MIEDYVFGVIFLFVIAITFLVAYYAMGQINDTFQADSKIPAIAKASIQDNTNKYATVMDFTFIFIYAAIIIGSIIISYVLPTNPGLYFALIIIIVLVSALAGYLANAYIQISSETSLVPIAANYPLMGFVITHYVIFTLVNGFILLIAFFARPAQEGYV